MAVTGIVLIIFVVAHLVGNLQIFEHPDRINGYSYFLQTLGPLLWIERIGLTACAVIHIWAATVLTIADRKARGPRPYRQNHWLKATLASRYMRWTGYVVLAFILFHLAQFTLGVPHSDTFKTALPAYTMVGDYHVMGLVAVRAGTVVPDVRAMEIFTFQNRVVSLFYIFAIGLLSLHLLHGADSLFQTLGWRNESWGRGLRAAVTVACAAYFLGNAAIPAGVMAGVVTASPSAPIAAR